MALIRLPNFECVCPLCGGELSYMTFSRLFKCSNCDQHYADDKAKYIKGGERLLSAAERYIAEHGRHP